MVVISNGFNKFHLSVAAAEAQKRGLLTAFITGAYPNPFLCECLRLLKCSQQRKIARLLARKEAIPDCLVHAMLWSEILYQIPYLLNNQYLTELSMKLNVKSFLDYGNRAATRLRIATSKGAKLYHYRAGFGNRSVEIAKSLGMFTLCDHSIVHPMILDYMVNHNGAWPDAGAQLELSAIWQLIMDDVLQADAVLVNSDFVKETFIYQGYNAANLNVIYSGVDDAFYSAALRCADQRPRDHSSRPLRVLFAGSFEKRKGIEVVMEAFRRNHDLNCELTIAGTIAAKVRKSNVDFFSDLRVRECGALSREELALQMSRADVFLFPSLAEGSARVIFEAMLCGCYIITTNNSGSIVINNEHGRIVMPGDVHQTVMALEEAVMDREKVWEIGQTNQSLIQSKYRQSCYGDNLAKLYWRLLAR